MLRAQEVPAPPEPSYPICHWISEDTWVPGTLTSNEISDHNFDENDIWAPFTTSQGTSDPGKNWPAGQAVLENGCAAPVEAVPPPVVENPPPGVVAPPVEPPAAAAAPPSPASTAAAQPYDPAPALPKTGPDVLILLLLAVVLLAGGAASAVKSYKKRQVRA